MIVARSEPVRSRPVPERSIGLVERLRRWRSVPTRRLLVAGALLLTGAAVGWGLADQDVEPAAPADEPAPAGDRLPAPDGDEPSPDEPLDPSGDPAEPARATPDAGGRGTSSLPHPPPPPLLPPTSVAAATDATAPSATATPSTPPASSTTTPATSSSTTVPSTTSSSTTTSSTTTSSTTTTSTVPTGPVETVTGTVNGCNTYGENCDGNPIYRDVPPPGYDWSTWPLVTTVDNGATLAARCWRTGATTYNYRVDPPDPGPDPYDSEVYFYVRAPGDQWGWIPDTYFVRDETGRLGLDECPDTV